MTGPQTPAAGATAPPLGAHAHSPLAENSAAVRSFVDGLMALVQGAQRPAPQGLSAAQRAFIDQLCALWREEEAAERAEAAATQQVIDGWPALTQRVAGGVAAQLTRLSDTQLSVLRLLEETPSLLGPLGLGRDERAHTGLLAWALNLNGPLGDQLRAAFLACIGAPFAAQGWAARAEAPAGEAGRIDVELRLPGLLCWLEVKVDAPEGVGQIAKYACHLEKVRKREPQLKTCLVFLTVDGRDPESGSADINLRFRDLLRGWAPIVVEARGPDALYLRLWMRSLAELDGLWAQGSARRWPIAQQLRALTLLRAEPTPAVPGGPAAPNTPTV